MPESTAWERFFDAHAPIYDDNVFTKSTAAEVEFLLDELRIPPGGAVLDVGCGTGRHAIELAKRGYVVTGLDLSAGMLSRAADKARAEKVDVEWVRSNATDFTFPGRYDAAVCLCEGAFGLLGRGDDPIDQPLSILCNISRSLKAQGKAVFTVLNGAGMLRRYRNQDVAEGRFDPLAMVESSESPPRAGLPAVAVRERGFVPTELRLLFRLAGLSVLDMWGGTAGNWGRRPLDLDEIEIMIVACKTAEPWAARDAVRTEETETMSEPTSGVSRAFQAFRDSAPRHSAAWMAAVQGLNGACALDPKTAHLAYLAVLAALRLESGIPFHVRLAKGAGASRDEVVSAILIGLPAAGHGVTQALPPALEAYDAE